MLIPFEKYQGTGNDFILLDQRDTTYLTRENTDKIQLLCDRRFGIGADGLMTMEKSREGSFKMVYFNADGRESSMCGNGGRCIVKYAQSLGIIDGKTIFEAIDGLHEAFVENDVVHLKMCDVPTIKHVLNGGYEIFTGSPHLVQFVNQLPEDVKVKGSEIRYSHPYQKEGININFVSILPNQKGIDMVTYERGVEDETLSCGTGVTAAALAFAAVHGAASPVEVQTKGGLLEVTFKPKGEGFSEIWLSGPAKHVFTGSVYLH